ERKFYETYSQPDFNSPLPWAQGPRRMGTDKNADVLWVGDSWGANLARIDTHTHETTYVPLPGQQQPYHVTVDRDHNAWTNIWGADRVMRYDPKTSTWTAFDLPTFVAVKLYAFPLHCDRTLWSWRSRTSWSPTCSGGSRPIRRSEEHTSELQSLTNLVCRLLLGKKKKKDKIRNDSDHNSMEPVHYKA